MIKFLGKVEIIGVNPYVIPPEKVLLKLFKEAGREKGPIPVKGKINGKDFIQTIVKYQNAWRLYLNTPMRKTTGIVVGDVADFSIEFDNSSREIPIHPKFKEALKKNEKAKIAFSKYAPSHQKEINRYLNNIKTESILIKNIDRVVRHLSGEKVERFVILRN